MIYMIIAGYFEDDASNELTNDPVFKAVLDKDVLSSQPTVSRFLIGWMKIPWRSVPGYWQNTKKKNLQYSNAGINYP